MTWLQFIVLVQGAALIGLAGWAFFKVRDIQKRIDRAHSEISEQRKSLLNVRYAVRGIKGQELDEELGLRF